MFVGAWGAQADELIERAHAAHGAPVHRVGRLTMLDPPQSAHGAWCCWLYGAPEDRGALAARFGFKPGGDLPAAFTRALAELGEVACQLLCGRFVVVASDRDHDRCLVMRDQLGAQPLVYTHTADGALFTEHERDLVDMLPRTPGPDRLALLQWIENGLTPLGRTLYEGVKRLQAGHRLILDETPARAERWWNLHYEGIENGTAAALTERLRAAAFAAVGRAAAGSRHPAVKLSGGLDSACVAAGLAANGFADGRATAVGGAFADHPIADETELIKATARHTRLPLELVAFDSANSMLAPALAHIARWRLPPATPNLFLWQPLVARARELGVDLMLDGEGGDELFGLAAYLIADTLHTGRLPAAWLLAGQIPGVGQNPSTRLRLRVLRRYGLAPLLPAFLRSLREMRTRAATSSDALIPRADANALAELRRSTKEAQRDGPRWWRYQAEVLVDMRDLLDMGSHFRREADDAKIDIRHPLLYDLQLIEVVLGLPPRVQFDAIRDRPLLRDALTGVIPEAVRTRHFKSHFSPLVLAGIRVDEAGLIEPLRHPGAPVRDYVAQEALDRKIAVSPDQRSMLGAGTLWRVAIANTWLAP